MTPKLLALLCLTVGLLVVVPSAEAQSAEMWVYAGLTADASQVYGYAEADLSYPSCSCTGWDYDSCWLDYDIYLQATLSHAGSTVESYSWDEYCSGVWITASETDPSPGTWDWNVGVSLYVNWHWVFYEYYYYECSNSLYGGGTYTANVPGGGGGSQDPPLIDTIAPSGALRGESGQLTITGEHFGDSPYVQVGDEGVTISNVTTSGAYLYADYSIDSSAASGDHAVTVSTQYWESNPVSFTVQDPNPTITSISPDAWYGWTTFSGTIYGSGFGNNPLVDAGPYTGVSANSSNGTAIDIMVTVSSAAPEGDQEVTVTSQGWGGQGFRSVGSGQQTPANSTVTIHAAPPNCGDQRDTIIQEYITRQVNFTPVCSWFNNGTAHSANFTNGNLRPGELTYTWSLITQSLTIAGSSGYGLDRWVEIYMQAHSGAPSRAIASGYRSPNHNAQYSDYTQTSRHMHGDAIDMVNSSGTEPEYWDLRNAAKDGNPNAGASWVEDLNGKCHLGCVHADWRNRGSVYVQ